VNDERLQILRMVEEGKITAQEAIKLLEALGGGESSAPGRRNRFVRIKIIDEGKTKVNVNLPLDLARVVLKFVPQTALANTSGQPIDWEALMRLLEEGAEGKLVDIEDDNTKVEVYVE